MDLLTLLVHNAWAVAAFPVAGFVLNSLLPVDRKKGLAMLITVFSTAGSLLWSCGILAWTFAHPGQSYSFSKVWLNTGSVSFALGWLIDNSSAMMLMVVTSVSILVQIFSHSYMSEDRSYRRFFALLALFNFSMLGIVLSPNFFQMYVFWEMVGVSSYLLIGFWHEKPEASAAAVKAFVMNRVGDLGFLAGLLLLGGYTLGWWQTQGLPFLDFAGLRQVAPLLQSAAGPTGVFLVGIGIFMGAAAKSAQVPLHTWLPDAMEGPTPVSALIHAATMVAAGVFMLTRAIPILELSKSVMDIIAIVGAVTALISALTAVGQYDIKRILAFSTCSQLGLMVMAIGGGAAAAGLFHLFTHAYFKAMLFLCSGAVIHGLAGEQDVRRMGGLRKSMPVVAWTYLIGVLAISGLLLSGFWSKEAMFSTLAANGREDLVFIGLTVSLLTSFYMFRSYFVVFEGPSRAEHHAHAPDAVLAVPLLVLAVPSLVIGFVFSGALGHWGIGSLIGYLNGPSAEGGESGHGLVIISLSLAVFGLLVAWLFYGRPGLASRQGLQKIAKPFMQVAYRRFFWDDLYDRLLQWLYLGWASVLAWFDRTAVDGTVNLAKPVFQGTSTAVRKTQTGRLQDYAAAVLAGGLVIGVIIALWVR